MPHTLTYIYKRKINSCYCYLSWTLLFMQITILIILDVEVQYRLYCIIIAIQFYSKNDTPKLKLRYLCEYLSGVCVFVCFDSIPTERFCLTLCMGDLCVLGSNSKSSTGSKIRTTSLRERARTNQFCAEALTLPSWLFKLSSTTNKDLRKKKDIENIEWIWHKNMREYY